MKTKDAGGGVEGTGTFIYIKMRGGVFKGLGYI
jgi:hypothetical protein